MRASSAVFTGNDVVVSRVDSNQAIAKVSGKGKTVKGQSEPDVIDLNSSDAAVGGMRDDDERAEAKLAKASPIRPKAQSQVSLS